MKKIVVITSALVALASNAHAGIFDGQSVEFQYYYPDLSSPYSDASNGTHAVGAGIEVSNLVDGIGTLDVGSNGFTAHFTADSWFSGGGFNGFRITDIGGTIASFTSFSMVGNTALGGAPVLSFDADNLYVNWADLSIANGGDVSFAVNVAAPVPEPETYAMMLAGLGLLGVVARRRKQKAVAA